MARGSARNLLLLLAACGLLGSGCTPSPQSPPSRIVLILIDTLRRDHLPMYGGDVEAPNIAALAARGVALEATASFHQTTMSMGALFTGRTPSIETPDPAVPLDWLDTTACGMARFAVDFREGECLPETLPTIAEKLRARGYHTIGVVANALLHDPAGFSRGFDHWHEVGKTSRPRPKKAAALRRWQVVNEAVRNALRDLPQAPLFLYVHYLDVHDWLYRGMTYAESVAEVDRGVGDLIGLLKERGLLADTAFVLAADHGELIEAEHVVKSLPLHFGNPSYRDVLEVPLVLVGAGGVALPEFVRTQDLHRLLLDLAGGAEPPAPDLSPDELFLTEATYQTYQRGRFKSFRRRDGETTLIDLANDPGELRDASAAHPEVLRVHRERVETLARELAAKPLRPDVTRPTEEWLDRLRALGYVE